MDEARARQAIVDEAVSWLGTPYHHQARIKGVGVDCAQLPAAVYEAVGLIEHIEPDYSPQWMLHHDEERYLAWVLPYAREIDAVDLQAGDFVIWKFGRTFSHGAIVIDRPTIIHAVSNVRCVAYGNMDIDAELIGRSRRCFTLFGTA